jgi:membrane protease YdiL (CAAX protease family)
VQLLVFVILAAGLLWCATPQFPPTLHELVELVDELGWESSFLFTGATSLAALLVIVPAVRLRIGPNVRSELNLRRLSPLQGMLIVAAVAPLALLSDQVYRWGMTANTWLASLSPELRYVFELDAMQIVKRQAESTPYPILLVALALAPAVSEELVFRGLIGRGLTARWGVRGGVVLTSLLFAAAHGSPAHALATLPIGLCLHVVYRLTGTLWGAILLHAGNNALAVTVMKLHTEATPAASPALLYASAGYLVVVLALLSQTAKRDSDLAQLPAAFHLGRAFPMLAGCSILEYICVLVWSQVATMQ